MFVRMLVRQKYESATFRLTVVCNKHSAPNLVAPDLVVFFFRVYLRPQHTCMNSLVTYTSVLFHVVFIFNIQWRISKGGVPLSRTFSTALVCVRTRLATHARKTTKRGVPQNSRNPPGSATDIFAMAHVSLLLSVPKIAVMNTGWKTVTWSRNSAVLKFPMSGDIGFRRLIN